MGEYSKDKLPVQENGPVTATHNNERTSKPGNNKQKEKRLKLLALAISVILIIGLVIVGMFFLYRSWPV